MTRVQRLNCLILCSFINNINIMTSSLYRICEYHSLYLLFKKVSSLITFYGFPINPNQVLWVDLKINLQLEATMELLSSQMESKQCLLSNLMSKIT